MGKQTILATGILLIGFASARADLYTFTYTDSGGSYTSGSGGAISGSGQLNLVSNGDGTFTATSGSMNLLPGANGMETGPFNLIPNPNGTTQYLFGGISLDDQIFPGGYSYTGHVSLLDKDGLSFKSSDGTQVMNLWNYGNGEGSAGFAVTSGIYPDIYHDGGHGTFQLTPGPTPEPLTFAIGLAGIGTFIRRRVAERRAIPRS